jgi:hypothetical protein
MAAPFFFNLNKSKIMYVIMKMSGSFLAKDLSGLNADEILEYIESFTSEGTPVTIVEEIQDAEELFEESIEEV